ncbi:MAG: hypothetical protein SFV81_26375, partial [Pirellulaceae bacterium]|nr:hypothetical protein [Pirellulaceae bacterium]
DNHRPGCQFTGQVIAHLKGLEVVETRYGMVLLTLEAGPAPTLLSPRLTDNVQQRLARWTYI